METPCISTHGDTLYIYTWRHPVYLHWYLHMETLCISTLISTHGDTMLYPCFIAGKHFTRKESSDSGISAGNSSRKTSTTSTISAGGILEEPSEETIKEETPFTEPDEDLCEKITQQVINQWPDCYVFNFIKERNIFMTNGHDNCIGFNDNPATRNTWSLFQIVTKNTLLTSLRLYLHMSSKWPSKKCN